MKIGTVNLKYLYVVHYITQLRMIIFITLFHENKCEILISALTEIY